MRPIFAALGIARTHKSRVSLFRGYNTRPTATLAQLESLKKALSFDRPPLCSGAISPSPGGLHLYYGKKDPRYVWFLSYAGPRVSEAFLDSSISPLQRPRTWDPSLRPVILPPLVAETRTSTTSLTARRSKWMPRILSSTPTSQVLV